MSNKISTEPPLRQSTAAAQPTGPSLAATSRQSHSCLISGLTPRIGRVSANARRSLDLVPLFAIERAHLLVHYRKFALDQVTTQLTAMAGDEFAIIKQRTNCLET